MDQPTNHCHSFIFVDESDLAMVESAIRFVRPTCQISVFSSEQLIFESISATKHSGLPSCLIASSGRLSRRPDGLIAQLRDITFLPVILLGAVATNNIIESIDSVTVVEQPLTEDRISVAVLKALGWSEKYCQLFQQSERFRLLSERELSIVTLATEGVPNKSIAKRLGISIKTIERNRRCAYEKLGVTSTAAMAMLFTFRKFCINDSVVSNPTMPKMMASPPATSIAFKAGG